MVRNSLYAAVALTAAMSTAQAAEWTAVGARSQAMSGAQVATPEGSQSILSNAAFLAKEARFDMALPVSVTVGAEGDIIEKADQLINSYDEADASGLSVEQAFNNLESTTVTPGDYQKSVGRIVKFLATDAAVLDAPGQGILANASGALTMRFGRLGLYAGYRGVGGASVRYDSQLDFKSTGGSSLITSGTVTNTNIDSTGVTASTQATTIANDNAVSGATDNLSAVSVQALANQISPTGQLSTAEAALLSNIVKEANTANNNPGSTASGLEIDNDSGLDLRFALIKEFGIGYGFSFYENRFHVAPVLKIMSGETTTSSINLADSTSEDKDIGDELTDDKNSKSSTEFTVDVGFLYEVNEQVQLGLTLKDLTSPGFETNTGSEIEFEPSARFGAAYSYSQRPGYRGVIAGDLDLIKTDSAVLTGSESQQAAVGISQELMGWLSLRGGFMKNFAGESDGMVYSAGLGIQISKFYLDIAGVFSSDDVTVDGDDYPTKGGGAVTLGWNMNY